MSNIVIAGSSKFGKALVEQAEKKNHEQLETRVLQNVQQKLDLIERQENFIKTATETLEFFNKQIAALRAGAFSMERSGAITFKDPDLNAIKSLVVRCAQCGYEKIVIAPV